LHPIVLSLVAASAAVDLAVLLAALLLPKRRPIGLGRLAFALFAAAGTSAIKLVPLLVAVRSLFVAIAVVYADLVVVVPLAALCVLVSSRRRAVTRPVRALAWLALLVPPPLGFYATFVEPFRLVEERVTVPVDPRHAPAEPLRVAVLADLQSREVDDHLREAVRRAMAFDPHLILLPGDLIQRAPNEYGKVVGDFRELLAPLDAPLGVYFVDGNTDEPERVAEVFEGTRVRLLVNETVEVAFAGRRIVIGGVTCGPKRERVRGFCEAFDRRESDELRILVSHYPDVALALDSVPGIDLVVAGHTHGGQVQLPFFGPPITLSAVPRRVAAGGLHLLNERWIYVSRGVGCERGPAPRIRFLCPPEVSLLSIVAR
jgi:predicted MPP superfamily phosphohydrolase